MLSDPTDALATPSTFGRVLLHPRTTAVYIAGTMCLTVGGIVVAVFGEGGWSLIPFWIGIALSGPLGAVAAIFLGVPIGQVIEYTSEPGPLAPPPSLLDGNILPGVLLLFATIALVAVLNVLLIRRWVYTTRASIDRGDARPVRRAILGIVGSGLFVYAGSLFVLLCFVAAYGSIVGTASDLNSPNTAGTGHLVILVSFLAAFASATAGLVIWIVFTKKRLPILIPAAIDLV